jgi:uracil-DNA glycosylase family 4
MKKPMWSKLNSQIISCERCPRLRAYGAQVATEKRKAFLEWDYWGRPVPNFGDSNATILVVGLAPAAHGAHRTGRMFTGDRSGEWLYRALYKAGLATQPQSSHLEDGLELNNCAITAVAHCAPPDNKPTLNEIQNCHHFLQDTFTLLPIKVVIALGGIAWEACLKEMRELDWLPQNSKKPKFSHGAEVSLKDSRWLLGSYHPSQQNTFTKRLTEPMFDDIFNRAQKHLQEKL